MKRNTLSIATTLALLGVLPVAAQAAATTNADSAITTSGTAVSIDVLANDTLGTPRSLQILLRPQHGTASVVNGRVLYTPVAGYTGSDSLQYTAKGTAGSGIGTVRIQVGQALVLQGRVVDSPIANALVTATVDGFNFSTTADADGNYSLPITGSGNSMVTMAAQGTGTQSAASFLSVVGQFDRLQAEAGDGTLSRDENNQVQVTNVSTAQAYLLQVANGGAPITDDTQLVAAREGLSNGDLLAMAGAIKLVVDGGYALPEGVTDTLALVSDPAALASFTQSVDAADPNAITAAVNEIAADPNLTVPTTVGEAVGTYTLIFDLGAPGTVSTGYIQGSRLTLAADGTGSYVIAARNANPSVSWTFEGGRAVVVPNAPVVNTSYEVINGVSHKRLNTLRQLQIAKLFDGAGRDTLAVTQTIDFSFPDSPAIPGGTNTGTSTFLGIRDGNGALPILPADVIGTTHALWVADTPIPNSNGTGIAMFTFAADGTGTRDNGTSFNWSIDGLGRLQAAFSNGDVASYALLKDDDREGQLVAGQWRTSAGAHSAAAQLTMEDQGIAFSAETAAQDWRSGFYVSRSKPEDVDFFMINDAGGNGWQLSYRYSDQANESMRLGWQVAIGNLESYYYRNGANEPVHFCQLGVDGCYLWQLRRWRPVAADGNRVYVIEDFLWDADLDGDLDLMNQRSNFYDAVDAPPFNPLAPPMAEGGSILRTKR